MKIIILGAGRVGTSVAENLVSEANDITLVDVDSNRLLSLQDHLDLRTVTGNASHPSVLIKAGAKDADLILAVTQSDETNLVACKLAATMFNIPTKIARIHSANYLTYPEIFSPENFGVDYAICPEQIVTDYIEKLIEFPSALQVLDFANGKVSLVAVRAFHGGPLVGRELRELRQHVPNIDTRVAAIFRKDRPIIPEGDTIVEAEDEVFFLAAAKDIRSVISELRRIDKPIERVMIAGGGNIGRRLSNALDKAQNKDYQVKLIEYDKRVSQHLAAELDHTLVLHGDATDESLLESENIAEMDIFCALTNDDENNIMSALLAKSMGASKVLALINRSAYVDLVHNSNIDIAISPAQVTIGSLLAYVRRGDVVAVHSLRRGAAEALEVVAHGDANSSNVVGRQVSDIKLPKGATIGAIVRGLSATENRGWNKEEVKKASLNHNAQVIIAHHDTVIEAEDHIIVFAINKKLVRQVEKLFQVGVGFL